MNAFGLTDPCLWCVDGNTPAGIHDILGPVYIPCRACIQLCPICEGEGLFPANFTCIACLVEHLAADNLAPVLCRCCSGLVDLIPYDTYDAVREVNPDAHHHRH